MHAVSRDNKVFCEEVRESSWRICALQTAATEGNTSRISQHINQGNPGQPRQHSGKHTDVLCIVQLVERV